MNAKVRRSGFAKHAAVVAGIAVLVVGAGIGWKYLAVDNGASRYLTAQVAQATIENHVTALGTLQPLQFVDVGTQVTGQLKKLHVDIGVRVEKGQVLAEIDPTLVEAKVSATRATIRSQTAQLAERRAQLDLVRAQHARQRTLFEANATSADALQQAAAAEKSAAAQIESLLAQIQQSQSTLQADEANLRYTKIHAPMAGTVVSLTAREGQTLVSSQQAPVILRIADLGTMTVSTQVSEADVPKVRVGMPVYFNTLGQPDRRWNGTVRQILPTPEVVNNVVLYNVLFDVDNRDGALKPQMSAQAYFVLARAENALTVPMAALQPAGAAGPRTRVASADAVSAIPEALAEPRQRTGQGRPARTEGAPRQHSEGTARPRNYLVRVLDAQGKVEERQVTVGVTNRIQAQVLSGLNAGETVIVGTAESAAPRPAAKGAATKGAATTRARL
jgi:membrane fusion protein, macrolide-specific efflux system